ncbi:MAG: ribosome assembly cofactor RimP [Bacteroidales bacterium]|jgi:ribosome maturation factor RimP|nr:ribosome assembly cofactor RimP [Bacteroidales bacterium]
MISKDIVKSIVQSFIEGQTIFLVDIRVDDTNRIFVEVDKPEGITIDECVSISRAIEASLDREIEDYELEVSSPGLTEPFKVIGQYQKNCGRMVDVVMKEGQKIKGLLQYVDDEGIMLEVEAKIREEGKKRPKIVKQSVPLKYNDIKATKVTITF